MAPDSGLPYPQVGIPQPHALQFLLLCHTGTSPTPLREPSFAARRVQGQYTQCGFVSGLSSQPSVACRQVQNYIANLQVNYNTSKASNLLTALSPRIKTLAYRLTIFLWFEGSTRSKASPYALCPVCSLSLYQHTMPTALYALPTDRRMHPSSRAV